MSNFERRADIKTAIKIRLAPAGTAELFPQERSLIVKPDFISKKMVEVKADLKKAFLGEEIALEGVKNKRLINQENKISEASVKAPDAETLKEKYNPEKVLDKLNIALRAMSRVRRSRSRCKNAPPHKYKECGSPFCRVARTMQEYRSQQPVPDSGYTINRNKKIA